MYNPRHWNFVKINKKFIKQDDQIRGIISKHIVCLPWEFSGNENLKLGIEYLLIVLDDKLTDLEDIKLVVQVNGYDIDDRFDYIFLNKIYPYRCEDLYDEETNDLLRQMVRDENGKFKNVLFYPFKRSKMQTIINPSTHEVKSEHIQLNFYFSDKIKNMDMFMTIYIKYEKY